MVNPCHERAPRGSKTGTQGLKGSKERSVIPERLCEHIVDICEQYEECGGFMIFIAFMLGAFTGNLVLILMMILFNAGGEE